MKLWEEFGEIFKEKEYTGELDYVTVDLVLTWLKRKGHSAYFIKNGQLLYTDVQTKKAVAFTEDSNHMYLYHTAVPFANMPVREIKNFSSADTPIH